MAPAGFSPELLNTANNLAKSLQTLATFNEPIDAWPNYSCIDGTTRWEKLGRLSIYNMKLRLYLGALHFYLLPISMGKSMLEVRIGPEPASTFDLFGGGPESLPMLDDKLVMGALAIIDQQLDGRLVQVARLACRMNESGFGKATFFAKFLLKYREL